MKSIFQASPVKKMKVIWPIINRAEVTIILAFPLILFQLLVFVRKSTDLWNSNKYFSVTVEFTLKIKIII